MMKDEEDVKVFLAECKESGDKAYVALKAILQRLHNAETRADARVFLERVETRVNGELGDVDSLAEFHFGIHELLLTDFEGFRANRQKLKLLELPSIFIPEDWSFTFLEGLNRHPESGFRDRDVVELGCGNGWISIALAERTSPRKVYGLDINPRAIKVAQINLYLNALNGDGSLILDQEGKSLLDRVEFHESDLLGYCLANNIMLDRIVGCIPQILNPNPEAMASMVSENAGEEFLHSLSNYCGLQGFVEDQFGLGLVARAAEEGIALLRPHGAMIFNMGGRPGQAVCERLFERRGFHINKLWQTRVNQAADTDILALVEIEKNSRHRFEFFMGRVCEEPINARTAYTYAKAGGEIAHGLSVYECRLRQPIQVKTIFKFLSDGWDQTRSALDLSFQEEAVADEKIPFLAHLARVMKANDFFPLEVPTGSGAMFWNLLSNFLRNYHRIPLTSESVVIVPSRSIAIENLLRLFSPQLVLVDSRLTRSLPKKWTASLPSLGASKSSTADNITVIEAPQRTDLVTQLVKHLKPQIVITSIAAFEMQTSTAFEQLLETSEKVGARLFLDISDHVELSSMPATNGVLQYMASHPLPLHAAIICGLVKNQVYSDLEIAFVISENSDLLSSLAKTGELTCGKTAISSQFYYGCLLHELLSFQLPDRHATAQRLPRTEGETSTFIKFAEHAVTAIRETEMCGLEDRSAVNLHIEENTLPIPAIVFVSIFEGFARQNITAAEMDPTPEISRFVRSKYGLSSEELVLSTSPTALFSKLVLACVEEQGTLCFPTGSNGTMVCAAKFLNANVKDIPTDVKNDFKLTGKALDEFLTTVKNPWLYISGPTIVPTGLIYSKSEITSILAVCKRHEARVILDTSSSGLEYDDAPCTWNLDEVTKSSEATKFQVALLGGFSCELLTGGIECAFAALNDSVFVDAFKDAFTLSKPHGTLQYSIKRLLQMLEDKSDALLDGIAQQKKMLKLRAQELQKVLVECGWNFIIPAGGCSMVASPSDYQGKVVSYAEKPNGPDSEVKLDSKNIRDVLYKTTGLCVSGSSWTGIPGYSRFILSCKEEVFQQALHCLRNFKNLAHSGKS